MSDNNFPWQYNFPPFFTMQPHTETRKKQLEAWRAMILQYCRRTKHCIIDVTDSIQIPIFNNISIHRTLSQNDITILLEYLADCGNSEPIDTRKKRWFIYWHTLNDWADLLYSWAQRSAFQNSVCTLYEIINSPNEEFTNLQEGILIKALRVLEARNKAELVLSDEYSGVKFL